MKFLRSDYLFILGQGEKMLDETVNTMNSIQSRGRFQLIFALSSLTFFFQDIIKESPSLQLELSLSFISTLSVSALLSLMGVYKYRIWAKGTDPKELMHNVFYNSYKEPKDAELNLIRNEAEQYSERIIANEAKNKKRLSYVTWSFFSLCASPVIALIIYFLLA